MVGRKKQPATDPRHALLHPLAAYRHKEMTVPTSNEKVIVREPGGDDYLVWQAQIQAVAGEDVTEENAQSVAERIESDSDHTPEASMLVRVLINPSNYQRVFSDEDVELVAANWGPVYGRFLNAAFELAGISGAAPVADAKKN